MKTIIFLNLRPNERYEFSKVYKPYEYRFVAIQSPEDYKCFPEEFKQYFTKIYQVNEETECGDLVKYTLSREATAKIVEAEIAQAGGSENVCVVCNDEGNISLSGYIRDQFQIPGPSYRDLLLYRDKVLMKKKLLKDDVRAPYYTSFDRAAAQKNLNQYYEELVAQLGSKFVVKPVDGYGSEITLIVTNLSEFEGCVDKIKNEKIIFEAEEFISGVLYHSDVLLQNSKIIKILTSEYSCPNLEFIHGKTISSLILLDDNPLLHRINMFVEEALESLGDFDGSRHMEIFLSDEDELVFLESAARIPGAMAAPNYEKMFGINLFNMNLQLRMGETVDVPDMPIEEYSFWGNIPLQEGKIKQLKDLPIQSRYEIIWLVKENDVVGVGSKSVRELAAYFYVYNTDYGILKEDFERLKNVQAVIYE